MKSVPDEHEKSERTRKLDMMIYNDRIKKRRRAGGNDVSPMETGERRAGNWKPGWLWRPPEGTKR
jgi:hypothetical protein